MSNCNARSESQMTKTVEEIRNNGKKIGYICLFTNIGYVTIHIICFIMMVVVLTSK